MAEQQLAYRQQRPREDQGIKSLLPEKRPTTSQVLAVVTLLPVGGTLLLLAGITLTGSLIGLAITTPLFIIFSPVLVPAAIVIGLAIAGFLTSGAFGITALSSLSWILNYLRRVRDPQWMEQAKRRTQETTRQLSQKAKEAAQSVESKAQEAGRGQEEGKAQT